MTFLKLLALTLTAIILIPGGAHFFELPSKITLGREDYFTVQGIYSGWALFGLPIIAAVLANGALFLTQRHQSPESARWALSSAVLIMSSLIIFFGWVFPANQATANWTIQPDSWALLRLQWEYGHALNAGIIFGDFLATAMATVRR